MAARCRAAKRPLKREESSEERAGPKVTTLAFEEMELTDAEWERLRPLLLSQRGQVGRPPSDHRGVLGGILWVARSGSSWREMPEEYGDWSTAYRRWRTWAERGLWQRILETLGEEALPGPVIKGVN